MKTRTQKIAFYATLLTGLLLVFIGGRFLLDPLGAETGFGIHVPVNGNFSFHYIKGIRDLFSGVVILVFLWAREQRGLGLLLLTAAMIPTVDFFIVLNTPGHATASLYPHLTAVMMALVLGGYYLSFTAKNPSHAVI